MARRAANLLTSELAPEKTARLCLGGAFTKDTGQRALARNASRVVAIEGCFIKCATRMMKGVVPGLNPEVVIADRLYDFDRKLFGIDEMPDAQISAHAREVANCTAMSLGFLRFGLTNVNAPFVASECTGFVQCRLQSASSSVQTHFDCGQR